MRLNESNHYVEFPVVLETALADSELNGITFFYKIPFPKNLKDKTSKINFGEDIKFL